MQTIGTRLERMATQRTKDPHTETLLAWLKAIATGGAVACEGKRVALRSSLTVACSIQLDTEFVKQVRGSSPGVTSQAPPPETRSCASGGHPAGLGAQGRGGQHATQTGASNVVVLRRRRECLRHPTETNEF